MTPQQKEEFIQEFHAIFGNTFDKNLEVMWQWISTHTQNEVREAVEEERKRSWNEGFMEGYKNGVSDELECVETSGEHADLQKKLTQKEKK